MILRFYKKNLKISLLFFVGILLFSCNLEQEKINAGMHIQHGFELYQQRCANCHQIDGSGLKQIIPPLKNSDYILQNRLKLPLIIKNGMHGKIMVNGLDYTIPMPSDTFLTNDEVAKLCNFVLIKFVNSDSIFTEEQVSQILN